MGLLILRIPNRSYYDNLRADPAELLPLLCLVMCFFHSWELITLWKWKGFNIEISAFSPLIWETRTTIVRGHLHLDILIMGWTEFISPSQLHPELSRAIQKDRSQDGCSGERVDCSWRSRIGILVLNTSNPESYFNCLSIHVLIFQLEQ